MSAKVPFGPWGSVRIARIAGIDLKIHVTFLLGVLAGAWQWRSEGWRGPLFGAGLTILVFLCVVLHELGHSLVARGFGIPVKDITLYPIGGVAVMGRRPETPLQELLVALAGPAVNVLLAVALWSLAPDLGPDWWQLDEVPPPSLRTGWALLYGANIVLAVFNLLPAFPMDGGRVFRALLCWFVDLERATRVAVGVGRLFAVLLFLAGLAYNPMLALLAVFVSLGASAELRELVEGRLISSIRLGDAVNPYLPRFFPNTTVAEALAVLVFSPSSAFAVEELGELRGVVTREALTRAAKDRRLETPVSTLMERVGEALPSHASLEAARQAMLESDRAYVAVELRETFLGLVTTADIARQLVVARAMGQTPPSPPRRS
jgi:Zn-dependent protease/CBS domain-containing protein